MSSVTGEIYNHAKWLIGAIAVGLESRGGEGVGEVLDRLAAQKLGPEEFREPEAGTLPVTRHLAECLGQAMVGEPRLAAAIAALSDHMSWHHSEAYSDRVLGEGFMDNYGWCELVGSAGFFPGDDFRLGLLMLGPHRHYKDHYHPAPELYWPLTGPSDWKRGAGGFATRQAFETIWHRAFIVHATKTLDQPLLTVWSWTRDTKEPARLVGA